MSKGSTIVISMYNVHNMGLDVTFMAPNLIRVSGEGADYAYLVTSAFPPPPVNSTYLVCT